DRPRPAGGIVPLPDQPGPGLRPHPVRPDPRGRPMSTGTLPRTGPASNAAGRAPSLARLVAVELRKSVDTRAGRWLLVVIGLLGVAAVSLLLVSGERADVTLGSVLVIAQLPVALLLPVLGLLLVTSEFSQRSALTTFTLVPHRGRVIGAKLVAVVGLGA